MSQYIKIGDDIHFVDSEIEVREAKIAMQQNGLAMSRIWITPLDHKTSDKDVRVDLYLHNQLALAEN